MKIATRKEERKSNEGREAEGSHAMPACRVGLLLLLCWLFFPHAVTADTSQDIIAEHLQQHVPTDFSFPSISIAQGEVFGNAVCCNICHDSSFTHPYSHKIL